MTTPKKGLIGELLSISLAQITPNPYQPRKTFDAGEIKQLAGSLETNGLLQPITLREKNDGGGYELLAGERRLRAAESLGWRKIAAIVKKVNDSQMAALALVENLQRQDLDPIEEAEGFKRLATEFKWSQAEIARQTGRKRSTVGDRMRALDLPDVWLALLRKGELQFSHTPVLHKFTALPDAAHKRVVMELRDTYEWEGAVAVETFERLAENYYSAEIHPLSELANGYDGPVITYQRRHRDQKPRQFAADRDKWQPLLEKQRASDAEKARSVPTSTRAPVNDYNRQERERAKKAKKLTQDRRAQASALVARAPDEWDRGLWLAALEWMCEELHSDSLHQAVKLFGLEPEKGKHGGRDYKGPILAHAEQAVTRALPTIALTLLLAPDVAVHPYASGGARRLAKAAELLGVSLKDLAPKEAAPSSAAAPPKSKKAQKREAKKRVRSAPDFMKALHPSPALAVVVGAEAIPRTGVTQKLWAYIKKHGLQDTKERRLINADDVMRPIFGKDQISMFDMTKAVNKHLRDEPWTSDVEVPVRVSDDAAQQIKSAVEHDDVGEVIERACVGCGCTDGEACEGGCSWIAIASATLGKRKLLPIGLCDGPRCGADGIDDPTEATVKLLELARDEGYNMIQLGTLADLVDVGEGGDGFLVDVEEEATA